MGQIHVPFEKLLDALGVPADMEQASGLGAPFIGPNRCRGASSSIKVLVRISVMTTDEWKPPMLEQEITNNRKRRQRGIKDEQLPFLVSPSLCTTIPHLSSSP